MAVFARKDLVEDLEWLQQAHKQSRNLLIRQREG